MSDRTVTAERKPEGARQHSGEHRPLHPPVRRVAIWAPILVVAVLACFLVLGIWRHVHANHQQQDFAQKNAATTVSVVEAARDTRPQELRLPGNIQAFQETTIYPRANGYVRKWAVDIGDNVQEGQVLAEIETPEVDQQLAQAQAAYDLAKVTADRWRDMVAKKVVAAQEYDEKEKAFEGARANLEQLQKTQGFNRIAAPFPGKITARNVEIGALVSAGSPLFRIAQRDPLRVYVYVPQTNVASMHEGVEAKILVQEFPGREFAGHVTRTAGALDPTSRAMQVEVQVPNKDLTLYPGMYGEVKFMLTNDNAPVVVPANAFAFRSDGAQVAMVKDGNQIHWQKIKIGRDFGSQIEVDDGLPEHARVVMNPTDDLREGLHVEIAPPDKKPPAPGGGGQTAAGK